MSGLEIKVLVCLTVGLMFNYFVPMLWVGVWDANTSHASSLYWGSLLGILAIDLMWIAYISSIVEIAIKKIKNR